MQTTAISVLEVVQASVAHVQVVTDWAEAQAVLDIRCHIPEAGQTVLVQECSNLVDEAHIIITAVHVVVRMTAIIVATIQAELLRIMVVLLQHLIMVLAVTPTVEDAAVVMVEEAASAEVEAVVVDSVAEDAVAAEASAEVVLEVMLVQISTILVL